MSNWLDYEKVCPACFAVERYSTHEGDGFMTCGKCGGEWNVVDDRSWLRERKATGPREMKIKRYYQPRRMIAAMYTKGWSVEKIARSMLCTRERVRQIVGGRGQA